MPTPIELLRRKLEVREAVQRAREAETAERESELGDLRTSLQVLTDSSGGFKTAFQDAISDSPRLSLQAAEVLESAAESLSRPSSSSHLSADDVLRLALATLRRQLGPKELVRNIIELAVERSGLSSGEVMRAALDSDLGVQDVIACALGAARQSANISAAQIIRPTVDVSFGLGFELPVIFKEFFVATVQRDPTLLRSCLLSVLG
jgi:hypothetical protein